MKEKIDSVAVLMSENYQIDISMYDDSFLEKTVNSRIVVLSLKSLSDYLVYLTDNSSEKFLLDESLNNSFSEFFRNPFTFLTLEQQLLPELFTTKVKNGSPRLRIWSAGCAGGHEPYSLAILAEDYRKINNQAVDLSVFATDKSEKEIKFARKGIYHLRAVQNTRLYHISNYFSNNGEYYSISPEIKRIVDFSVFDFLGEGSSAPPSSIYGDFDMIMCCNILFYYKPEVQKKIISGLYNSLLTGGFLITGEAEVGIIKSFRGFKQLSTLAAIFVKT